MKKTTFLLWVLFCTALAVPTNAQELFTLKGKVTSEGSLLPGANVMSKNTITKAVTDFDGKFEIETYVGDVLEISYVGFKSKEIKVKNRDNLNVVLNESQNTLDEVVVVGYGAETKVSFTSSVISTRVPGLSIQNTSYHQQNSESYAKLEENEFHHVKAQPLSTFSIDVDRAAYSNIRRMINNGQDIPADAVRIEEMINYFNYDYPKPEGDEPFCIDTEVVQTPWNPDTRLVKVGIQGKEIPLENLPSSNLVFLLDVSGSMGASNKLPLLKSAFKLLVNQLREEDKVSIVVYAGAAGTVLEPTNGSNKTQILNALNNLNAGGSTAGGAGLQLAYKLAEEQFIDGGNNRIILATDGDFNVGLSSDSAMEDLITEKRKTGIFFTALGFGMGNYKDSKLENLADKGNGNYAYIDTMQEARKVLGTEFGGTLYTIAKDVKIQVEFNPALVQGYRLIGYENRMLNAEDFQDDTKDAGEIGSGHTVTALYEVVPTGVKTPFLKPVDDLKYSTTIPSGEADANELMQVKVRYKKPDGDHSMLVEQPVPNTFKAMENASADFNFMAGVALFGMQLRDSPFSNGADQAVTLNLAEKGRATDAEGFRAEFIRLVKAANSL
ncbi:MULTISPECIES: von Willebrand factor type A domain-containing protein [unclassified Leeuwenhoekiella]|uniref:vWA domain-containing protein n=1 Tax=unclassified Leeuwenhoekiella TaxID=2615029 RepID=UPI000C41B889|nr:MULTISPECIES: von Willebrand factor type A domain-containing protein [unclassified Leeuwenhoekiella]MAW96719.1 hypothetical protein [Leeuwenhoekiella sp.]MBA81608.1 hypothetical protein [Leeuwenhoekiella sp.]|tara:strand:- start:38952 stop:40781 length:1830 start_codon:yes stop_codon:yes gene_type:complete